MKDGHFHLHTTAVARSRGHSAVAAAAYQANQRLTHQGQRLGSIEVDDHRRALTRGIITDELREAVRETHLFTASLAEAEHLRQETISAALREQFRAAGVALDGRLRLFAHDDGMGFTIRVSGAKAAQAEESLADDTADMVVREDEPRPLWAMRGMAESQSYQCRITADGIDVTAHHGIWFSRQATAEREGKRQWRITDGDRQFIVKEFEERRTNPATKKREVVRRGLDIYGDAVHDHRAKGDCREDWLHIPANAPAWITDIARNNGAIAGEDRQAIWQATEQADPNRDGRPAQKIECSFLRELSYAENKAALMTFIDEQFTPKGYLVDVAIHEKTASDGGKNIHAHLLIACRKFTKSGTFARTKDDSYWSSPRRVREWRNGWADKLNEALADAESDTRVDHRNYQVRGIDKTPGDHLGAAAWEQEQRGKDTDRGNTNRRTKAANDRREMANTYARVLGLESLEAVPAAARDLREASHILAEGWQDVSDLQHTSIALRPTPDDAQGTSSSRTRHLGQIARPPVPHHDHVADRRGIIATAMHQTRRLGAAFATQIRHYTTLLKQQTSAFTREESVFTRYRHLADRAAQSTQREHEHER